MSHVSQDFIPVFGDCIRMIRYAESRSLLSTALSLPVRSCSQRRPNLSSSAAVAPLVGTRSRLSHISPPGSIFTCEFRSPRTLLNREKMRSFSTPDILVTASLTGQPASSFSVYPIKTNPYQASRHMAHQLPSSRLRSVVPFPSILSPLHSKTSATKFSHSHT